MIGMLAIYSDEYLKALEERMRMLSSFVSCGKPKKKEKRR